MTPELKKFIYMKNGWKLPAAKGDKPTTGKLVCIYCGQTTILFENMPFPFLNKKKRELLKDPQYVGCTLKVTY